MERRSCPIFTHSRCRLIETVRPPLVVTAIRRALIFNKPNFRASETVRMLYAAPEST